MADKKDKSSKSKKILHILHVILEFLRNIGKVLASKVIAGAAALGLASATTGRAAAGGGGFSTVGVVAICCLAVVAIAVGGVMVLGGGHSNDQNTGPQITSNNLSTPSGPLTTGLVSSLPGVPRPAVASLITNQGSNQLYAEATPLTPLIIVKSTITTLDMTGSESAWYLVAKVLDNDGNPVNGGNVVFIYNHQGTGVVDEDTGILDQTVVDTLGSSTVNGGNASIMLDPFYHYDDPFSLIANYQGTSNYSPSSVNWTIT